MGFWLLMVDPGLLKGGWESKELKKRQVLQCSLNSADGHDRTYGTNIFKIVVTMSEAKWNVMVCC